MFKITGGKGFHITFLNGWTVSVQFGPANYCDNYDMPLSYLDEVRRVRLCNLESQTAEIAAWNNEGFWYEFDEENVVKGYMSPNEVLAFMNKIANIKYGDKVPMTKVGAWRNIDFRGEDVDTPGT